MLCLGDENYENLQMYGNPTFNELHDIMENGLNIRGVFHSIEVVSCCDWKAAACLDGKSENF